MAYTFMGKWVYILPTRGCIEHLAMNGEQQVGDRDHSSGIRRDQVGAPVPPNIIQGLEVRCDLRDSLMNKVSSKHQLSPKSFRNLQ